MEWPRISEEWFDEFLRRAAAKGKWSFTWRIGILAWGGAMVCGLNWWFDSMTSYPRLAVLVLTVLVCLPAGALLGSVLYARAQKTPGERRETWLQQKKCGKASFVWRYGVLRFGGPMFLVLTTLLLFTIGVVFQMIAFCFLLCLMGGAVWGAWVWSRLETKYQL
jgi:hypothetical protein